jgi:hypothetical protein
LSEATSSRLNFVRQQGFRSASREACSFQYPALMWQPRVTGFLVLIGLVFQPWPYFMALSAVLWWNVLLPSLNPFDALYNLLVARPRHLPPLEPAPSPRRFSQAMAATFMLSIGLSLLLGLYVLAWAIEAVLLLALGALIFGRYCLGSYLYLLFTGESDFARRTLPWAHEE